MLYDRRVTDLDAALHHAAGLIGEYRRGAATARVGATATREAVAAALDPALPDDPQPLGAVIDDLVAGAAPGLVCTPGPRFFGFVVGGSVDAALVADLLASGWDQNAFNAALSPAAMAFEDVAGAWLKDLLGIPASASVGFVTGAGAANTVGLAAGRSRVLAARGWDAGRDGLAGAPRVRILASVERHATVDRALRLLGIGDGAIEELPALANGEMDAAAVAAALASDPGAPAIVCAQAGNVNTGACDDLRAIAAATREHGAWLHVDGAFGLFAALSPRSAHLVRGIDRAHSIAADAHKWLNVPYESGFALIREPGRLGSAFGMPGAAYLPGPQDPGGGYGLYGPESSRRARSLPIWATLAAYGRQGYRAMVERHLDLAQHLARRVDEAPELERLADVPLCIVCFRVARPGLPDAELDRWNRAVGDALIADGRVFCGTTVYGGRVALRPAIVNWRTTPADIDLFVDVVRELADRTRAER